MFFQNRNSKQNTVTTVPAPIGGLNARDSLAAMPETDAVLLRNWWPEPYGCTVRRGYQQWVTGMPGPVRTLAEWNNSDGTIKLFAWSQNSMYDVSIPGIVGAPILSSLSTAFWQTAQLVNAAGANLLAFSGADNGIIYRDTGVARIVAGDGIAPNTWAGLNPVKAVQPVVHQRRLWVVEVDSSNGWFLPPDAVQGTLLKFDFGPLFAHGGYLDFLAAWTIDDGAGARDYLVAMSSEGDAVVYGGTDPEDDTAWGLVGVYYIGSPVIGRRAHTKIGGDLVITTQEGLISMAAQLTVSRGSPAAEPVISDKIKFLLSELVTQGTTLPGWSVKYFAKFNMILINVPTLTSNAVIQLAANEIIQAWTVFTGMNAASWSQFDNTPYFGDFNGNVLAAWTGGEDEVLVNGTGGTAITAEVQQAYSYLKLPALQKQVGMYRPVFILDQPITFNSEILYDFKTDTLTVPTPPAFVGISLWNLAFWNQSNWGGGSSVQKAWVQASGMGNAVSLRMILQSSNEVLWVSTDYSYRVGESVL